MEIERFEVTGAPIFFEKAALDLEWATLVDRIASRTVSVAGGRHVRALSPAETIAEAKKPGAKARAEEAPAATPPTVKKAAAAKPHGRKKQVG